MVVCVGEDSASVLPALRDLSVRQVRMLATACECQWEAGDSYLYSTYSTPVSSLLYAACIHQLELEPCGVFYCFNGGECVNDTSCQCAAGFGGETCDLAFCECHTGAVLSGGLWQEQRT